MLYTRHTHLPALNSHLSLLQLKLTLFESKHGEAIFVHIRLKSVNASVWTLHKEWPVLKNLLWAKRLHQFVTTEPIDLDKTKEQKVHESSGWASVWPDAAPDRERWVVRSFCHHCCWPRRSLWWGRKTEGRLQSMAVETQCERIFPCWIEIKLRKWVHFWIFPIYGNIYIYECVRMYCTFYNKSKTL